MIAYDTRTHDYKPETIHRMAGSLGLWAHHMHWLLHDQYCERPTGTDDKAKPRLQINPQTWTAEGGGEHLGASLTSSMVKRPAGAGEGSGGLLVPPAEWAAQTTVTSFSVAVADPQAWWPGAGHAGGPGNLHPIDVQFWFENIRRNTEARLAAWFEKQTKR